MKSSRRLISLYKNSELARRIINGSFWNIIGAVSSKSLILAASIMVAQLLGKVAYGEYSIIRTTIFMFIALASMGVGATSTKYIAQYRNSDLQKAQNIYIVTTIFSSIFGLFIAIIIVLLSDYIATEQLGAPNLSEPIKWGAILLWFCSVNGSQSGALSGFENFKSIAINSFISGVIEFISIIVGTLYFGIIGAIIGSAIGYSVLTILNHKSIKNHFTNKTISGWRNLKKDDFKIIWNFGFPAALCNLLVIFALWYSRTYLVRYGGFGDIAIYNAADQVKSFILFIPGTLSAIILPILSNLEALGNKDSYTKIFNINVAINVGIASALAIIISLFAHQILGLWGKEFVEPIPLIILSVSTIFSAFATVVGQAIASLGKMWIGLLCNLIWGCIVVIVSITLVNKGLGATGLAFAILISYMIHGLYQYLYLRYSLVKNFKPTNN